MLNNQKWSDIECTMQEELELKFMEQKLGHVKDRIASINNNISTIRHQAKLD